MHTLAIPKAREVPMAPSPPIAASDFAQAVAGLRRAAQLALVAEQMDRALSRIAGAAV